MTTQSDDIEESSITQVIYDDNQSSSLTLSGTDVILQNINEPGFLYSDKLQLTQSKLSIINTAQSSNINIISDQIMFQCNDIYEGYIQGGSIMSIGNNTNIDGIFGVGINLLINADKDLQINHNCGNSGDVLTSSGSGVPPTWTTPASLEAYATTSDVNASLVSYATITNVNTSLEAYATTSNVNTSLEAYATISNVNTSLEAYATITSVNTSLEAYATITSVNTSLEEYATISNVNTSLEAYAKTSNVNTSLEAYATTSNVNTSLEAYATITSVNTSLEAYATITSVNTSLEAYATISNVNTSLEAYATTSNVNTSLEAYATITNVNTSLESYATITSVNTSLEAYATTSNVNTSLEAYAKTSNVNTTLSNYSNKNIQNIFTQPNTFTTITATTINADHLTVNQLPIEGNELVSKSYVDSLVGQYSGGLNLYLNYSNTNGSYKELSNKIISHATETINTQLITDTYVTIASFITPVAYPCINAIPTGIWNMTVYGDVSSNITGTINYYFKVYKYITESSSILIATSTPSNDVNALNGATGSPTAYYMQATVPETIVNLTDRILINLDISSNGAPINTNICTYFENDYYSYIQTSLNDGTNILSAYNTWTGNNTFDITPNVPIPVSDIDSSYAINVRYLNTRLTTYPTNTSVSANYATIASYPTNTSVSANYATIASYPTNTSVSANYPTNTSVSANYATIANYPTNTSVSANYATIASYPTNTSVSANYATIASYPTNTSVSANYATIATLSNYATIASLGNYATSTTTSNEFPVGVLTNTLDTTTANSLTIGGTNATSTLLGNITNPTTINANNLTINANGNTGTNGQVLTRGASYASWVNASWVGTATGPLNMGSNVIYTHNIEAPYSGYNNISGYRIQIAGNNGDVYLGNSVNTTKLISDKLMIHTAGNEGTKGQILTRMTNYVSWADPPDSTWVGNATGTLNMSSNDIVKAKSITANTLNASTLNVSIIDSTSGGLIIGGNTHSTTIGSNSWNTTINGHLKIGNMGTTGQYLMSYNGYCGWGDLPFVGTFGSLDMTGHSMINVADIDSGINGTIILGGTNAMVKIGNVDRKTHIYSNNLIIDTAGSSGTMGQVLTRKASYAEWATPSATTATWSGTATGPLNMGGYTIDATSNNLSIGTLTSTALTLGKATNTTNIQGIIQINGQPGTAGQVLKSNGTGVAPTWDTNWSGTATTNLNMGGYTIDATSNNLSIGTLSSTALTLGKATNTTNIQGIIQINGQPGTSGHVLKSNGAGVAPTWAALSATAATWSGTATTNLNMGGYTIDATSNNLSIGTLSSTALTLGKATNTTNIQGIIQINGQPGTSGHVLKSNGAGVAPTWSAPSATAATWSGTATTNLNMSNYSIGGTTILGISSPIQPTYSYTALTGTNNANTIGYTITSSISAVSSISTLVQTPIVNLQIVDTGVYMISIYLNISNTSTAGVNDRLRVYLGFGVINNLSNNVWGVSIVKLSLGNSIDTGSIQNYIYCTGYTVITANNYLCLSAQNTGNSVLSITPSSSFIQVIRIA